MSSGYDGMLADRYDEWLYDFEARSRRGNVPEGWRRGDPKFIPGKSLYVYADPFGPREEGNPDEPLSFEAWCQFVEPEMTLHFDSYDLWRERFARLPGALELLEQAEHREG